MRYLLPIFKGALQLYLVTILWFFLFRYHPSDPAYDPPLTIFIGDTINLLVHEAGHFFFSLLGRTLYLMGGSLFQVLFAGGITVFVWRRNPDFTVYPLFWTGWNFCNVAMYIGDAPFRKLRLIRSGLTHDWHAIMNRLNLMDSALLISEIVHWIGLLLCLLAIGHGIKHLIGEYRVIRSEAVSA